jgi:acyl-CoA dehydrogenase
MNGRFGLSDEQKAMRQTAREFAKKEIRPVAMEIDHKMSNDFPVEVVCKAARLGFTTIRIPEEHGGGGGGDFKLALMTEELAWEDAGLASTIGGTMCWPPSLSYTR